MLSKEILRARNYGNTVHRTEYAVSCRRSEVDDVGDEQFAPVCFVDYRDSVQPVLIGPVLKLV